MTTPDRVLLDTSVVIDLERIELGALASADHAASAVSIAELGYGLNTDDPVARHSRSERYHAVLEGFEIWPYDLSAAKLFGPLAGLVRASGRNPRPRRLDLQIAATAVAHSVPLLTRNPRDFDGLERMLGVIAV
ncbi:MAG: type II toxin-antitoxin system VapC family toxin [Jiangellaceae bacterium]